MADIPASPIASTAAESNTTTPLPIAEQRVWRLVNHGLAWTLLGVMILALAGLCVLLGEAMQIVASSTSGNVSGAGWGASSPAAGKHLLVIKVLFIVAGVGTGLGLIALTTGLAFGGALCPVRPARWLAFATLAASYATVYGTANAIFLYPPQQQSSYGSNRADSAVAAFTSGTILAALGFVALLLLGQAALASIAHAWNDQKTLGRIKWYLKCQFALPALLLAVGFACGILLPPSIAMILIVTATLAAYVYLAVLLLRNIYLLHRSILWQLEPELAKVPPPPLPKPVIDPLAD